MTDNEDSAIYGLILCLMLPFEILFKAISLKLAWNWFVVLMWPQLPMIPSVWMAMGLTVALAFFTPWKAQKSRTLKGSVDHSVFSLGFAVLLIAILCVARVAS